MSAPIKVLGLALALALAGCSGGAGDTTAPEPDPPAPPAQPTPPPPPPAPGPVDPDPNPGVQGNYVLAQINNSLPGQLVTIANPEGMVIGLYRFEATTLSLAALQTFELALRYTDDKTQYGIDDEGEFKQAGPVSQGALPLTFSSDVYGDSFTGVVLEDIVAIKGVPSCSASSSRFSPPRSVSPARPKPSARTRSVRRRAG